MNYHMRPLLALTLLISVFHVHAAIFKIATLSPEGTGWMEEMRGAAAEIKEKTQGRVVLKFYPGGVMGSDNSVLRKIRIGQLQGGAVTSGSLSEIYADIDIYSLPYIFSSLTQVDYVREKMDSVIVEGLEKNGFVTFGLAEGGFAYMMSDKPLHTADDVRNQRVWVPSGNTVGEAVFRSAEISPVTLQLADVLTALQTGLVNTVIASPIGAIALQWHTKVKYLVDMPLTYFSALLVLDKAAFEKIRKEDQDMVRTVMSASFLRIDKKNREDNLGAREALRKQGIEFITLSQDAMNEWRAIGDKAMLKLEQQNSYSDANFRLLMKNVEAARNIQSN